MKKTLLVLGAVAILFAATGLTQEAQRTQRSLGMQRNALPRQIAPRQNVLSNVLNYNYHWVSVVDADTQKPLAGVKATLHFTKFGGKETDTRVARSDAQGRIFFPLPSALNADQTFGASILIEREGYASECSGCQVQWAERSLTEGKTVCDTFPLQKAEQITGRLVDEQGKPLANTLIAVQRQKTKPYGNEGLTSLTVSSEYRSDASGRFRIDAAKNEKVAFWAVPENLAPRYVSANQQRGDLGNITVEKGFEPLVTVLDKDGRPVQNVWVNLNHRNESYGMAQRSADTRSALTNQNGQARFRPVLAGDYEVCVSEKPLECRYNSWSMFANTTSGRAARTESRTESPRPVKGTYFITPVFLSAASPQASLQAQDTISVNVQFSDRANNAYRELSTNVYGRQSDGRYFVARFSPSSSSAYRGNGLFSFQVPVGLENASLYIPSSTRTAYRARIAGNNDWLEAGNSSMNSLRLNHIVQASASQSSASQGNGNVSLISSDTQASRAGSDSTANWIAADYSREFPLGTVSQTMAVDVASYKSPQITLNVVNESGQPVREYYAWMDYAKNGSPAKINIDGNKIHVEMSAGQHEFNWDFANKDFSLSGIFDVSFKPKNFGKDNARINAEGILPNEAMYLYVVGKGYSVQMQEISQMSEGETRTLTVTLKK